MPTFDVSPHVLNLQHGNWWKKCMATRCDNVCHHMATYMPMYGNIYATIWPMYGCTALPRCQTMQKGAGMYANKVWQCMPTYMPMYGNVAKLCKKVQECMPTYANYGNIMATEYDI